MTKSERPAWLVAILWLTVNMATFIAFGNEYLMVANYLYMLALAVYTFHRYNKKKRNGKKN